MVNLTIEQLIRGIKGDNFIDTVKVLKVKYGISYTALALSSKINANTLRGMVMKNYYSDSAVEVGAYNLKRFYLGDSE